MKNLKVLSIFFIVAILFSGCSNDDDASNDRDEDISQQVENFLTNETLQSLRNLGFTFNNGTDTPDISGSFRISPAILSNTNISGDFETGYQFGDIGLSFANLNPSERTFDLSLTGVVTGEDLGSFYNGSDNSFNAFARILASSGGDEGIIIIAVNGIVTSEGINDLQFAFLVEDNMGNTTSFAGNGQGRLIVDGNGTASRP